MEKNCPVCGKKFVVSWPGQWSYKAAGVYICSWGCLQKKRKEAEEMARPRKNQAPAVELAKQDVKIAEEVIKTEADDREVWKTAAVRNKKMGTFYLDEKYGTVDWRSPFGEEISLLPQDWKWLADHIEMILHTLGVEV